MSIIYIDTRSVMDTTKSCIKDSFIVTINQNNIKKIKDEEIQLSTIFRQSTIEDFFAKISTVNHVVILIKTEISQLAIEFIQEYLTKDTPYMIHVYTDYIKNIPEENIFKSLKLNILPPSKRQLLNNFSVSQQFIDFYSNDVDKPTEIIPGLFLSGVNCANDFILQKYNIQNVLSVMSNPPELDETKYTQMKIKILDSSSVNIYEHFKTTHEFINKSLQEKQNILVHCYAGISRSATIVISYLMNLQKIPVGVAYKFVKEKRSIVEPNIGFCYYLEKFEKEIFNTTDQDTHGAKAI